MTSDCWLDHHKTSEAMLCFTKFYSILSECSYFCCVELSACPFKVWNSSDPKDNFLFYAFIMSNKVISYCIAKTCPEEQSIFAPLSAAASKVAQIPPRCRVPQCTKLSFLVNNSLEQASFSHIPAKHTGMCVNLSLFPVDATNGFTIWFPVAHSIYIYILEAPVYPSEFTTGPPGCGRACWNCCARSFSPNAFQK